jgi:hypothetical protein
MLKQIVIVGCVMNLLSSGVPTVGESTRERTVTGYWTRNSELSDVRPFETGIAFENDVEGSEVSESAWQATEPAPRNAVQASLRELLDPGEHLTFAPTEGGYVTIIDGRGTARVYGTSGQPEWLAFDGGPRKTKTVWRGLELQQEMWIGAPISITRSYLPLPDSDRLMVTVVLRMAGSSDQSFVWIYDSDRVP